MLVFSIGGGGRRVSFSASMYDKIVFFIKMETQKLGSEWQLS